MVSVIHVCEWRTRSCLSQLVDNVADQYVRRLGEDEAAANIIQSAATNQSRSISNIFNHSHLVQVFLMSMGTLKILRCSG